MTDEITKFHRTLWISGWFEHPTDALTGIELRGTRLLGRHLDLDPPRRATPTGPVHQGFRLECLMAEQARPDDLELQVRIGRRRHLVGLDELRDDRTANFPSRALWDRFAAAVTALDTAAVLAVGGRDRSSTGNFRQFGSHPVTILDVVDAPEVDVVVDVHELDRLGELGPFDAFFSDSVFEHLFMPWVAVTQLNRVLRVGALGYVAAPQSIGLHDLPWDFWRISDEAWPALFNTATGFEIIDRAMDHPNFVLPGLWRADHVDAERTRGFEVSAVMVRKTGPSSVSWPVRVGDVIDTSYPTA